MESDPLSMTQDCVEWNESNTNSVDLLALVNTTTPAHHHRRQHSDSITSGTKKYSPNQEIEDLFKSVTTATTTGESTPLRRSASLPQKSRRQRQKNNYHHNNNKPSFADLLQSNKNPTTNRPPRNNNNKRKRQPFPPPHSESNRTSNKSTAADVGFDDLLRQLDDPPSAVAVPHSTHTKNLHQPANRSRPSTAPSSLRPSKQLMVDTRASHHDGNTIVSRQQVIQSRSTMTTTPMMAPPPQFKPSIASRSITTISNDNTPRAAAIVTPTDEFDTDAFDFTDDDLLAMDAAVQAVSQEHVVVEAVAAASNNTTNNNNNTVQIQLDDSYSITPTNTNSNRQSFGDPFGDDFDFSEIDRLVDNAKQVEIQASQQEPPKPLLMDITSLQLPQTNQTVSNLRATDHDPNRSHLRFSRYRVVAIYDDAKSYTKALLVESWNREMEEEEHDQKALMHRPGGARKVQQKHDDDDDDDLPTGQGWIFLLGEWYHTPAKLMDTFNLCSLGGNFQTTVDALPVMLHTNPPPGSDADDDLMLVLHPDTLVPPTMISEAITCPRKGVLKARLGSSGLSNKAALYGTMRHDLFEECMNQGDFSIKFAKQAIQRIVRDNAENLVGLRIGEEEAKKEVLRLLPPLQQFRKAFLDHPGKENRPLDNSGTLEGNGLQPHMKLAARSVECTEELLVTAELGLKGNIDTTIVATSQNLSSHFVRNPKPPETAIMGIELKTGHNQASNSAHMAQLALYILMMGVRYGKSSLDNTHASDTGMLLYINHEDYKSYRNTLRTDEVKSLLGQRNILASEMQRSSRPRGVELTYDDDDKQVVKVHPQPPPVVLPTVLTAQQPCERCFANRECMLYAATQQQASVATTHEKLLSHFCGHLDQHDLQYLLEWDRLIDLEAAAAGPSITKTWLVPSHDRERDTGKCMSSLVLEERFNVLSSSTDDDAGGSKWIPVILRRSKNSITKTDLNRLKIEQGNHVVISADTTSAVSSSEKRQSIASRRSLMHIARGIVRTIDSEKIIVHVARQESLKLNKEHQSAKVHHQEMKFRVDKDEVVTGLGTLRQNIINLFTGDVEPFMNSKADLRLSQNVLVRNRYAWLREVIVKLREPQFDFRKSQAMFQHVNDAQIPGCDINQLRNEFEGLNGDQKSAVASVWSANDYTLIQGLPGTGKSSTIVFTARLLAAHGKRVLISSYTHAAVDNLMMKLIEKGVSATSVRNESSKLIRIGRKSTTHPAVEPILLSAVATNLQRVMDKNGTSTSPSADAIRATISNARIVGLTALSIPRSSVLIGQEFDVVIVDEAGQITQPAILGAVMAADTFVLVGDHKQLQPVVTSEAAEKAGYGVSMLSRLAEKHPDTVAMLTLQYRMHEDICQICNDIVYEGRLRCATETVRTQTLNLPRFDHRMLDGWVQGIINPQQSVVFANTDFFETLPDSNDTSKHTKRLISLENRHDNSNMVNDAEISLVKRMIDELLKAGLPASSIAVLSPFRAQVRKFDESDTIKNWKVEGLEVSTIDRFQGRDKEAIIISFVRSNPKGFSGRLLNDFRRLNVAVSRAMKKLILVGSYSTLHKGSTVFRPVLEGLTSRKQVRDIPEHVMRAQKALS